MEILIVTPEVAPYGRHGGVADVSRALPRALHALGHSVTVLSPLYPEIDPGRFSLARRLSGLQLDLGGRRYDCELYDGKTASGVNLLFIGSRAAFSPRPLEGDQAEARAVRAGLLCRTAVEIAAEREPGFDLVQAHEWMASLALVWAAERLPDLPRVLLAHDLVRQGKLGRAQFDSLSLSQQAGQQLRLGEDLCLLKGGVLAAHRVVSGSAAAFDDIGIEGGAGALPDLLGWMEDKLSSIENGLDAAVWNPVTDLHLKTHFDPVNLAGKYRCKAALQHELGLPVRNDAPLFVHLAEPSVDNGTDLLERCAARLLNNDLQLLVCSPDAGAPDGLQELALRFPDRFQLLVSEQQVTLHRALAASDLLLLSTGYQPYGALQMCAHRYGSLPVGRRAGSVADTVVDCDSSLRTGTGFLFERNDVDEMLSAVQRAASAFHRGEAFEQLRRKVMLIDHSWERCAGRYQYLYQSLAGKGRRMAS